LRSVREQFASILTPLVLLACAVWVAVLGFINVHARREEVGILRTFGVSANQILKMFLTKHVFLGVLGGLMGFLVGILSAGYLGKILEETTFPIFKLFFLEPGLLALSVGGATALAVLAGWIPTLVAARQDPAAVLREE
jgi:putative ABC transport system permease protein